MLSTQASGVVVACTRCGSVIECCAFCETDGCPDPVCYRCLRIELGESRAQPHRHGG